MVGTGRFDGPNGCFAASPRKRFDGATRSDIGLLAVGSGSIFRQRSDFVGEGTEWSALADDFRTLLVDPSWCMTEPDPVLHNFERA